MAMGQAPAPARARASAEPAPGAGTPPAKAADGPGAGTEPSPSPPPTPTPAPFTEADAAPLFASGPLARAQADFAAERWDAAAKGFQQARRPEARYLAGVALVQARHGPEALQALAGLGQAFPELADRVAFWRARAHELVGDDALAAAAYGAVGEQSLLWAEAQLDRARAFARSKDRLGALEALTPLLQASRSGGGALAEVVPDALLLAGRLHAAGGDAPDRAAARRALLDCWAEYPLAGAAAVCLEELRKLPGHAGAPPDAEDVVRRAEQLLEGNRNAAALAALEKLTPTLAEPGPGQPLSCRARFALGKAHRKQRQHAKAIEALRPVVERCQDPSLRVRALYVLASAASIVAPDDGLGWYRTLAHDYAEHPLADDALFYAADLLARAGQVPQAIAALSELCERYPKGDFRAEALFRMAWLEKQSGHRDAALAALARIEREYEATDAYEHARAVYWRARIVAERGGEQDGASAREAWRSLVERYPGDYYGLLARARLEEASRGSAPWPRVPAVPQEGLRYQPGDLVRDGHFRAGVLLLRMGVARAAAAELRAVDRKALATGEALPLVAELLDRAGDHKSAHGLIRSLARAALRQRPEGAALRIWRVAYPQAFRSEVERWAPPSGVPPDLLLALMREESGLDPAVVSGAGAVGLTQLMLPTAQGVARKLRMGTVGQADLVRPAVSIRIGASYLGGLLSRYGGSEALALAAYNAGEVPVRSWLRARGSLPLDAFVEEIPVQETRGYVKRVLRSYAAYRLLYGATSARPVLIGQALPALR